MLVEQIWTANSWRNYNYVVACEETGEALAIDPLDHQKCLAMARSKGWTITKIINTHEHGDHTGGNDAMVAATGAKIYAHPKAAYRIPNIDVGIEAGDIVKVGRSVELEVLDTPGHTFAHVCLRAHGDQPCLFCGDTLFNAGAGNTTNGGDTASLFMTFAEQLIRLPNETRIYPGHDYIQKNIGFSRAYEPTNNAARAMETAVQAHDPATGFFTTLGQEKEINLFFRALDPNIVDKIAANISLDPKSSAPVDVFIALRNLRNSW